jgi:hypothetical protein
MPDRDIGPSPWWVTGSLDQIAWRDIVDEALVGWRAWHVVATPDGPALVSWWLNTEWPAREKLEASCPHHGAMPARSHDCGIHGFHSLDEVLTYIGQAPAPREARFVRRVDGCIGLAAGQVSLWGRAVAHQRGWRAQYAYPYDLVLLEGDRRLARALADRYAVETHHAR